MPAAAIAMVNLFAHPEPLLAVILLISVMILFQMAEKSKKAGFTPGLLSPQPEKNLDFVGVAALELGLARAALAGRAVALGERLLRAAGAKLGYVVAGLTALYEGGAGIGLEHVFLAHRHPPGRFKGNR
jgi:hypothetical protein